MIDDACCTSDPHISAIGEVACHHERVYGLVGPGYAMARTLVAQLTGGTTTFDGADTSTKLKLLGVDVATFGSTAPDPEGAERIEFTDPADGIHRRITVVDGRVCGGALVGDVSRFDALASLVGQPIDEVPLGALVVPGSLAAVEFEASDDALLCSCNGVTRGDVKGAIATGIHDQAELKACTKAGTGCGGCVPDLAILRTAELDRLGVAVDHSLCEHFAHSRQELFDLIRFHRHSSWAEVLSAHGTGRGCEICRPTVASILASLSNGYILDGDQAALQDTNDHALANMQRNGTYSVIPRVPGGEITPDQLIAIGEIARDYDLYTKITGAQRIDLLGARLQELPFTWSRVIEAGLESGHAYGKALRTVKSCDRFLMFYIRTADRLQRTAAWFEQLEGGMDHLRSVIIDDSLGICAELEADMAAHVESYECEWTATLDDPERLSHFIEFVNAPDASSTPVWITERDQRIPERDRVEVLA